MSDNSTEATTPITSPRIIKRVVVRRVVPPQNGSGNATQTITTTTSPPSSYSSPSTIPEKIDHNIIEVAVQYPISSMDENITESPNLTTALQFSPLLSPRMNTFREDEPSQSTTNGSTSHNNSNGLSTFGTSKETDSCMSPPILLDGGKSLVNSDQQQTVKKTDQRRSTSNLSPQSSSKRHSAGGVFGFLQRIASPLLSPLEQKQYSSSFSEGHIDSPRSPNGHMRARSGGKAIANAQLADEKFVTGFLKDCQSLREKRKFAELEKLCRDFLQRYYSSKTNMARAHIFLALALREGLLFKDSLRHFDEAFELDNDVNSENNQEQTTHVHTYLLDIADYAHTLFCDQQYDLAIEYFEKALAISVRENQSNAEELKSAIILCQIMSPKFDSSQKEELIDDLLKKSNNQQAFTYYVIGLYYEKLQDYNKAIEYYTFSLKREPSYDCNYERIGTCQSKIGLLERAKCNLDMACTLNKQNFRAILALAKLHLRAGMTGSCKTKLKIIVERSVQLVNSSSDKQRLYMILAESFYLLGIIKSSCEFENNFEKVRSLYMEAIHYYSLYHNLVQDDPEELKKYSVESYYNTLGLCYLHMREYETAMDMFHKAAQIAPNSCDGLYNKGVVMEQLGHFKEALQYYNKALRVAPNDQDSSDAIKRVNRKYKNSLYTHFGMIGMDICK